MCPTHDLLRADNARAEEEVMGVVIAFSSILHTGVSAHDLLVVFKGGRLRIRDTPRSPRVGTPSQRLRMMPCTRCVFLSRASVFTVAQRRLSFQDNTLLALMSASRLVSCRVVVSVGCVLSVT